MEEATEVLALAIALKDLAVCIENLTKNGKQDYPLYSELVKIAESISSEIAERFSVY